MCICISTEWTFYFVKSCVRSRSKSDVGIFSCRAQVECACGHYVAFVLIETVECEQ